MQTRIEARKEIASQRIKRKAECDKKQTTFQQTFTFDGKEKKNRTKIQNQKS